MFTVEHEFDNSLIVVLDDTGNHEDILAYLYDDVVFLCQWCDAIQDYNIIVITPNQFDQLIQSYVSEEGVYV